MFINCELTNKARYDRFMSTGGFMADYKTIKPLADEWLTDNEIGERLQIRGIDVAKILKQNSYANPIPFEEVVRLNSEKFGLTELADRTGVLKQTLSQKFKDNFLIPKRHKNYRNYRPLPIADKDLVATYLGDEDNEGLSLVKIADKLNIGFARVRTRLKRIGKDIVNHDVHKTENGLSRAPLPSKAILIQLLSRLKSNGESTTIADLAEQLNCSEKGIKRKLNINS